MNYQFGLEPYKTKANRYSYPRCDRKHCFAKYINMNIGEYISSLVSRCNHADSCGYHCKPKQYFTKNNISFEPTLPTRKVKSAEKITCIPLEIFKQSLQVYEQNKFVLFLTKLFGLEETNKLISKYFIGTSSKCYRKETGRWMGATVVWFIDIKGRIRAGQVKLFDETGHTAKYIDREG